MSENKDVAEDLGSSHCYASVLEHYRQLIEYVRPEVEGELVEADVVLAELLHSQMWVEKAIGELRVIKLELARIREMVVMDRFDEGCQRRSFLDLASRVLDA